MTRLPAKVVSVGVPPIKCQGIKTKLVPFILGSIRWDEGDSGTWVEPFLGSGVVAFNLAPKRAILADSNVHIIRLYAAIQSGEIDASMVRDHLQGEGRQLQEHGATHYYSVRDRFNSEGNPLDFLFLNRSCFNGVMRFNRKGRFNVPFGHKPERFSKAYITKITNQVSWAARQMRGNDWLFKTWSWRETLAATKASDFVYLDPPYIGRHTDYYTFWDEGEAEDLARISQRLAGGFALSMWLENRHRRNQHLDNFWPGLELLVTEHFYHVGSTESLRNEMREALVVKPGYADRTWEITKTSESPRPAQLAFSV